ncbi:MAG: two component transcriptional regulator, winged helix family [Mycobacterium sp.]|nr:two component transcriptional regulator, winged helix family [Mycobacterium sp.]
MAQLLLVEDDVAIRTSLIRALTERGHAVTSAPTAMAGLQAAVEPGVELVLLDLGLPDLDGLTLLTMLRAVTRVPVIITTARDDEQEIVRLLEAGADDYVIKPFTAEQLHARVRAVLRRTADSHDGEGALELGGLRVDARSREATVDGVPLQLARKEFDLLLFLAGRAGEVVSKQTLLAEVWHQPYGGSDKTVDVHLSWLRRKLGETASQPRFLVSVRGVGVKLAVPEP